MVFRARSTRKVLSAEMLPKSTNSVRYLGGGGKGCVRVKGQVMGQNEAQNEDSQGILVFGVTVEMQGTGQGLQAPIGA